MHALLLLLVFVAPAAAQEMYEVTIDQDRLGGIADFSFLNHPLTAADRVFVRDGRFYRVGADLKPNTSDDTRVRFFGTNLCFGGNFPEEQDAARIAKRMRKLGINLVRLHHMDSSPDDDPQAARSLLTTGPYPSLNPVAVKRLRALLDALKAEGIYIDLNLHVGYVFRPEADKVPALPEGMPMPFQSKPLHIFHPRMIALQTEYTRKVIEALKLKGDPVLAMVEIDNESSLVEAWQRGNLQKYAQGEYAKELDRQWKEYTAGGERGEYLLFLAGRDRHYLREMLGAVRAAADQWVPVAGTQMGYGGLLNLDTHADLDYQDNHFYIDHYNFPNQRWDPRDWRIRDTSSVGTGLATFLNMAAAREAGKPYTVSEFNQPYPNRQAAEIDPTLAAFGAFQDWDSIMHFAYSHNREWDNRAPSGFDINGDWTKFPNIGQSAWLFRSGAIEAARKFVEIPISAGQRLKSAQEKRIGNFAAFLETQGYDPQLALVHAVGLAKDAKPSRWPAKGAAPFRSDTGQLTCDPDLKLYLMHASKAAGVFGFAGTQKVAAGALEVELAPSTRGFAAILLTALDDRPIEKSVRLLLSTPGYTLRTQPGTQPSQPQKLVPYAGAQDWFTLEPEPAFPNKPSGNRSGGVIPVWMERVESFVTVKTAVPRLAVYPLNSAGARMRPLDGQAVERVKGGHRIHLQAAGQELAPWYELAAER